MSDVYPQKEAPHLWNDAHEGQPNYVGKDHFLDLSQEGTVNKCLRKCTMIYYNYS